MGLGYGMLNPALFALTIDLSPAENRGRGVASLYMAMEAGIGLGSLFSGYLMGSGEELIRSSWMLSAVLIVIAIGFITVMDALRSVRSTA